MVIFHCHAWLPEGRSFNPLSLQYLIFFPSPPGASLELRPHSCTRRCRLRWRPRQGREKFFSKLVSTVVGRSGWLVGWLVGWDMLGWSQKKVFSTGSDWGGLMLQPCRWCHCPQAQWVAQVLRWWANGVDCPYPKNLSPWCPRSERWFRVGVAPDPQNHLTDVRQA